MRALGLLLSVACGAALATTQVASLDLPLMLANGERILDLGAIPRTNVFSWVHRDFPYVNDKWGFMVLVAGAWRLGGVAGLWALKIALGAAMGGLLHALAARTTTPGRATGLACLGLAMLAYRLFLRAEWVSYLFTAGALLLVPGVLARRRCAAIAIVLLVPLWAVFHLYWFTIPFLLLAAGAATRSIRTLLAGGLSVGAAALSPFGVDNLLHPFRISRQLADTNLREAITELRWPFAGDAPLTVFHALAIVLAFLVVFAIVANFRARRPADAAVLLVLLALSFQVDRNLAMLGLAVPLVAASPVSAAIARVLPAGGVLALVVLAGTWFRVPAIAAEREPGSGWQEGLYPWKLASEFDPAWRGEHWANDLSIGSFLDLARGESFIDGNTHGFPPDFLREYRALLEGEVTVPEIDAEYRPDAWALRHAGRPTRVLVLGLFLGGEWAPAKWDDVATVFRRDLDPGAADASWKRWLRDEYLPRAAAWFPSADAALADARAQGLTGLALWRRAAETSPWNGRFHAEIARELEAGGDRTTAARWWRLALRLTPDDDARRPR